MIRNVLSLFDGISCGRHALEKANIPFGTYYASEIDTGSIAVSQKNYPNTVQLGNVEQWKDWDLKEVDLIMGGSPCQGFAAQGHQLNFDDPRSKLFFTMVDIIKHFKPKYFLLENVGMRTEWENIITEYMGVQPIHICSSLVSPQTRYRVYWANWTTSPPKKTQNHHLSAILEKDDGMIRPASIVGRKINPLTGKREDHNPNLKHIQCIQVKKDISKIGCLTSVEKDSVLSNLPHGRYVDAFKKYTNGEHYRYLTVHECERLQTLPDDYTKAGLSDRKRKVMLGNAWTVNVIVHLLEQAVGIKPVVREQRTLFEW
tara:strand:- start:445 stop:1389 length:945 start_codon:yes stop_codon:yes gene_type:complete